MRLLGIIPDRPARLALWSLLCPAHYFASITSGVQCRLWWWLDLASEPATEHADTLDCELPVNLWGGPVVEYARNQIVVVRPVQVFGEDQGEPDGL
jgi:hypothetical protein